MTRVWKLDKAKSDMSMSVEHALTQGPQIIEQDGAESVVVMSYEEYRRVMVREKNIVEFFRESPLICVELDLRRDKSDL